MRGCVNSKTRMAIAAALVAAGLAGTALAAPAAAATNFPSSRTLGIEGRVSLELRSGDYRPRPMDDRAELILRIEDIHSASNQPPRYDFRYLGFEAGDYALADFLMRPDGSRPEELSNVLIHVQSMLPADHDGKLTRYAPRRFPFMGGYRAFLALLSLPRNMTDDSLKSFAGEWADSHGYDDPEIFPDSVVSQLAAGNVTTFALQPGQSWYAVPGQTTVTSVNAATTGHKFACAVW